MKLLNTELEKIRTEKADEMALRVQMESKVRVGALTWMAGVVSSIPRQTLSPSCETLNQGPMYQFYKLSMKKNYCSFHISLSKAFWR